MTRRIETSDRSTTCPRCGVDGDSPTVVYRHLQVDHRKSAIADALLDATPARKEPLVPR